MDKPDCSSWLRVQIESGIGTLTGRPFLTAVFMRVRWVSELEGLYLVYQDHVVLSNN